MISRPQTSPIVFFPPWSGSWTERFASLSRSPASWRLRHLDLVFLPVSLHCHAISLPLSNFKLCCGSDLPPTPLFSTHCKGLFRFRTGTPGTVVVCTASRADVLQLRELIHLFGVCVCVWTDGSTHSHHSPLSVMFSFCCHRAGGHRLPGRRGGAHGGHPARQWAADPLVCRWVVYHRRSVRSGL